MPPTPIVRRMAAGLAGLLLGIAVTACAGSTRTPPATSGNTRTPLSAGSGAPWPDVSPEPGMESAGTPAREGSGPETPAPPVGAPSVNLPALPMGSQNVDVSADNLQCVTAAWLGTPIPAGIAITVTSVRIKPTDYFELRGSCGSPSCDRATLTADNNFCYFAAMPLIYMDDNATRAGVVTFTGTAHCDAGKRQLCDDFVARSAHDSGSLRQFRLSPPWPPESAAPTPTGT